MVFIDIDISSIVEEFNLFLSQTEDLSNQILQRLVNQYMVNWERIVSENLNQTKAEYLSAINVEFVDAFNAIIQLDGNKSPLALKLEEGAAPWDIKESLKLSANVKTSKSGGWYIDVPFRFATSEAIASSPVFSAIMPAPVQRAVRKVAPQPLKRSQIPAGYGDVGYRKEITSPVNIPRYDHKVSVYEGLRRMQAGQRGGVYMNFRRVSDNSDDYSWIHPGLHARKFMDKVLNELPVDDIVDNVIDQYLSDL